jgi:hypothetical protein
VLGEEAPADREDELVGLGVDEVEVAVGGAEQLAGLRDDALERAADVETVEQVERRRVQCLELGVPALEGGRGAHALRDVLDHRDDAIRRARTVAHGRGARPDIDVGTVGAPVAVDVHPDLLARDQLAEPRAKASAVLRRDPRRLMPDHCLVRIAEHAPRGVVPLADTAVDAEEDDPRGRRGEHRAVQLLRRLERLVACGSLERRRGLVPEQPQRLEAGPLRNQAIGGVVDPDEAGDAAVIAAPRSDEPVAVPRARAEAVS